MADLALRAASAATLVLLPALIVQGGRLRRRIPKIPEAAGPTHGEIAGRDPALRLLVLGESTAAGVGAAHHEEGITGCVARSLAQRSGRGVRWQVLGRNGATAEVTRRELLAGAAGEVCADVAVIVLGVNDVMRLGSVARWQRHLRELIVDVRARCGAIPVVLAAVPPMSQFPALPQPLRSVLGLRAHVLDRAVMGVAAEMKDVRHVPMPGRLTEDVAKYFCADGFHPSPAGYAVWGEALGSAAAELVGATGRSTTT